MCRCRSPRTCRPPRNCSTRPRSAWPDSRRRSGTPSGLRSRRWRGSRAKQKLLILLTDGNDTASRVPPEHAADIARQKDMAVYTIGVGDPAASGENRVDLGVLQSRGGNDRRTLLPRRGRRAVAGDLCRHRPARAGETRHVVVAPEAAAVPVAARRGGRSGIGVVARPVAERRTGTERSASSCMTQPAFRSTCCGHCGCSR